MGLGLAAISLPGEGKRALEVVMQFASLLMTSLLVLAGPDDGVVSKSGVFMNNVLLIGPDAHVSLYNHSKETIDVSGWSLNHENKSAKKGDWVLPDGTSIGAGESLVIANSAQAYKKAHGKSPDLELATGKDVADDGDVANVKSAEGSGEIRTSDEDEGALVLRDKEGRMRSHMSFRPESPPHLLKEQQKWNEIPTAAELAQQAGSGAADSAAGGDGGPGGGAIDGQKVAAGLQALEDAKALETAGGATGSAVAPGAASAGGQGDAAAGAESDSSGSVWPWIAGLLALLIAVVLWRRRDA